VHPLTRLKLNKIVSALIFSDLALLTGWGLVNPILAVFIMQRIAGGSLTAVGIAVAIFWFTRAVLQIPVAAYMERTPGERDDYQILIMGLMLAAVAAFLMPLATTVMHIYLIEFVHAVAFSFYIPAWTSIFSHHVDPEHTAVEWAIDRSVSALATGASALLGGIVAAMYGFNAVFLIAGVLSLVAAIGVMFGPTMTFPHKLGKVRHPLQALSEGIISKAK
jgi:MFS family permease